MQTYTVGDWAFIIHGEALESLRELPSDSADALCVDPPSSCSFMGRSWDSDKGGRKQWVGWLSEIMREVYRVLKPGAHGLVWSLPRRQHWTAWALEDAGFEIRDCFAVLQCYGQGFPKSRNISADIDTLAGAEPIVIGEKPWKNQNIRGGRTVGGGEHEQRHETAPATDEALQWDGWGTALKPAYEPWILVRKPLSEKNIALNVLAHGAGGINVGACEVGRAADDVPGWHKTGSYGRTNGYLDSGNTFKIRDMPPEEVQARRGSKGRHPPNLVLIHSEHCVQIGTHRVKGCPATVIQGGKDGGGYDVGSSDGTRRDIFEGYGDAEGMEEVALWACVPGCPVRELDSQSGKTKSSGGRIGKKSDSGIYNPPSKNAFRKGDPGFGDIGSASRFFPCFAYVPKPSRSEKEKGLEDLEVGTLNRVNAGGLEHEERFKPVQVKNNHNTVKAITFCRWLCRLICPPGGLVLDCFAGSGSIGAACALEGFHYLGIEQGEPPGDDRFIRIILGRLTHWAKEAGRE